MKKLLFFLSVCLAMSGSLKAQNENQDTLLSPINPNAEYPNYICTDTLDKYKGYWNKWCKDHKLNIANPVRISTGDLKMMSNLAQPSPIKYLEAYFALLAPPKKGKEINIAIVFNKKDSGFTAGINRWATWAKDNISQRGKWPTGFIINYLDLGSIHLLETCNNIPQEFLAYFIFHSQSDADSNRIAMVFCPIFRSCTQPEVENSQIGSEKDRKMATGNSPINIDFTNPCPPYGIGTHDQ
jgi:hypothetical protein